MLWMLAAMALFALEDAVIKAVATALPLAQVLLLFGLGGAAVFAVIARRQGLALCPPAAFTGVMQVRAGFEIAGRLFYSLAIALTPLSSATAILQATPVVVVFGAAVLLGERVGLVRWCAIGVGLLGVLCIVRPGSGDFSALSLLAVVGMIGFAGRDLASRAAPASLGTAILGLYGFLALAVAGGLYGFWAQEPVVWPSIGSVGLLALAVAVGVAAYSSLMRAMRTGDVSAVTPFRYSRLLFGLALGVVVFGERIDPVMAVGCALIVLAGLATLRTAPGQHG